MPGLVGDILGIVLRFLHIVFGVMWIGAVFYGVGVLRVALPRVDMPARKAVLRHLLPVAIHYIPVSAIMTIITGAILYLYLGQFQGVILLGTEWGRILLGALLLTLATFAYGMVIVIGAGKAIARHLEEEACNHQAEVGALQRRFNVGQIVVLVLGLVIIAIMVYVSEAL